MPVDDEPYLLLVEDFADAIKHYTRSMEPYLAVRVATTLAEAETRIRADGRRIAATVLDECLPDGSGTEMMKPLRAECPGLLLVISALSQRDLAVQPKTLRARFAEKSSAILPDLARFAATAAIQEELQRLVTSMTEGTTLDERHRKLMLCAPWVPWGELSDVLDISVSSVRSYIGHINKALGIGTYERLRQLLDPFHIFHQRGGRRRASATFRRIETLDDLRIPIEEKGSNDPQR
jgi:hypothetical protein